MAFARKAPQVVTVFDPVRKAWQLISGRGSVGRYGIIGVTGVAIDLILFAFLTGAGMFPVVATAISTLGGIVNNYTWNSLLNFRVALSNKRGAKFLTVGFVGLASSAGLLQLFIVSGLDDFDAKSLTIPIVAGGQFLANKFWTFNST